MRMSVVERDLGADKLAFLKAVGINHLCADGPGGYGFDRLGYWDVAELEEARKRCEAHGIALDMLTLPLNSVSVDRVALPNIIRATPERDAEIERLSACIRAAAQAGVPSVKFNFTVGGVLRTEPVVGRAGAVHTAFDYSKYTFRPTSAGEVSADEMWARLGYLLDKLTPVIEETGLRISLHPHDPAVPLGVGMDDRVLRDIASLERYLEMTRSPLFGLTFCQGCIAESGATTEEIVAGASRFGHRIFMVHFRAIVGGYLNFREAFPDEGEIDMVAVMRAYHATAPDHMLIVPDHYPRIPGDTPWGHQSRAYAIGYIKALIRAAGGETE
jgi:mannonate dehydratase